MKQAAISNSFSLATIEDGKDGALVQVSRNTILYDANSTGAATSAQAFTITYSLIVGNVTISSSNVTATVLPPTNATVTRVTSSGCTINVANGKSPNGVITITLTGTYNNNSYTAKGTITIAPNKAGAGGERGKVGRFYYYGGVFNAGDESNLFTVNDARAPYFSHISSGQTLYHVFNPDEDVDDDFTMKEMWYESNQSWNNKPWVAMTNDFKYLITEAIFGNFAQFGSAIISGDWMMSTNGTINGTSYNNGAPYNNSPAYMWFDPSYPSQSVNTTHNVNGTTWTGYNFVPNYCVDLLTGATYQQNAYVAGSIYTQSIGTKFKEISFDGTAKLYVGLDENNSYQPSNDGIWNFKLTPQKTTSQINIILPTNKYAHFGQRVIIYHSGFGLGGGQEATISAHSVNDLGITGHDHWLVGLSVEPHSSSDPFPLNSFDPVGSISFVNGVIELMCIPPYDTSEDDLCDWCVVNVGTNYYRLSEM